jgi:hypothetical protein
MLLFSSCLLSPLSYNHPFPQGFLCPCHGETRVEQDEVPFPWTPALYMKPLSGFKADLWLWGTPILSLDVDPQQTANNPVCVCFECKTIFSFQHKMQHLSIVHKRVCPGNIFFRATGYTLYLCHTVVLRRACSADERTNSCSLLCVHGKLPLSAHCYHSNWNSSSK